MYIKESFLYHYTNLGKIFDLKLVNSIFSCLDVNSWHLLAGTCQVQLVFFFDSDSTPSFGHSVIFPHPPCPLARAGKLPSLYGGTYHTHRHERLPFCIEDSRDLFYFTQDGVVTCE
jgi:hypothetical protein